MGSVVNRLVHHVPGYNNARIFPVQQGHQPRNIVFQAPEHSFAVQARCGSIISFMKEVLPCFDMPDQNMSVHPEAVLPGKIQQRPCAVQMHRDKGFIPAFPDEPPAFVPVNHKIRLQFVFRRQDAELLLHQIPGFILSESRPGSGRPKVKPAGIDFLQGRNFLLLRSQNAGRQQTQGQNPCDDFLHFHIPPIKRSSGCRFIIHDSGKSSTRSQGIHERQTEP